MSIVIQLPEALERDLRSRLSDLDATAREAFAVELYRQRKLSHRQLSEILGLSRFETDAVLKRHEVYYDITVEDINREVEQIEAIRRSKPS